MQNKGSGEHSFLGLSDRTWALLSSIVTVLGISLGLFGVFWAVFEYRQNQEARRTEYTLTVIESWEEHGYRVAYGNLRVANESFIKEVPQAEMDLAEQSELARGNLMRNFVRKIETNPRLQDDIRNVMYFFNRLAICIEANVCSVTTSKYFFDDTIGTFLQVYGPYVSKHQASFPGNSRTVYALSHKLNSGAQPRR